MNQRGEGCSQLSLQDSGEWWQVRMLTQLAVTVRIPVSASTLLICWPRETAQVSVFGCLVRQKPAGREWDGFSLNFH